ncbi:hypothetical protein CF67_15014 (plasmid) [Candidatus Photodesmus blepharus]|uniref:Nucleotidyl transferase domain-containing protein n=1 Tax=Candidatus Photodesmus blepharonis TaxID=1179155 RepID=A0A084CNW9_9GAMM|nr:sugar phosphate nucleotidyltransferase [Candidatus Photodesmus blepharus]KEY91498.1 hypothetical protein CF67_15014 [Candidatus Photodesmus blepharus]
MHVVIPMSGIGKRFLDAGYKEPKFLIKIDGKFVIQHVIELFPCADRFTFICNSKHLKETNIRKILTKLKPKSNIVEIKPHKLGPVYAVLQAEHYINDEEETIISYCDFGTYWNFLDFLRDVRDRNADSAIPAYKGFHPHMLGNTNYAFMRDKDQWMVEIQEKKPFTKNRMEEYASNGIYYFKNGKIIKKYFPKLIERGFDLHGEYYVSLVFNLIKEDKLTTYIYEIKYMLQWGTPSDLEEYKNWSYYFNTSKNFFLNKKVVSVDHLVIPMSGLGSRFSSDGYKKPKPLLPVDKEPMYSFAIKSCPSYKKLHLSILEKHNKEHNILNSILRIYPESNIKEIKSVTSGQATTCSLLTKDIADSESLFITSCDSACIWDQKKFAKLIQKEKAEVIIFAFKNHQHANLHPNQYGWLKTDNGQVKTVSVKKQISKLVSNDYGITGSFFFSKKRIFKEAYAKLIEDNARVNNEFYIDSMINYINSKIMILEVDFYISLGTPNEYKTFHYWKNYHKLMKSCKYDPYFKF